MVYSGLFQLGHLIGDLLYGCKTAEEQSAGDQSLFEIGAFLVPLDHCDALLTANYESMLRFHKENGNAITMVCAYKNLNIPYGVVKIGRAGVIDSMEEKPLLSFLVNTGIYIVEPEVIDDIEDGVPIGFPDIVERERRLGKKVAAYPVSENDWMDMGQLPELEKMRIKLYGE